MNQISSLNYSCAVKRRKAKTNQNKNYTKQAKFLNKVNNSIFTTPKQDQTKTFY